MQDLDGAPRFVATTAAGLGLVVLAGLALTALLGALDAALVGAVDVGAAPPLLLEALATPGWVVVGGTVHATLAVALLIRGEHRLALVTALTGAGALVLVGAVPALAGRFGAPGPPGGHAVTVTVWVGTVLLVALPAVPRRARGAVIVTGAVLVVAVGLARFGLGEPLLSGVVAGWLVGAAWLLVTVAAFRAWRGHHHSPWREGLDPDAAPALVPAPDHVPVERRRAALVRLLVVAGVLLGVLVALGQLVTGLLPATPLGAADVGLVRTLEGLRVPVLDAVSLPAGELGNTHVVILLGAVAAVLGVAITRRWRPAVLVAAALVGETVLFVMATMITGRERPPVRPLDAQLPPTSSFPSGHTAAAVALYGGIAVLVLGATRAWWRWLVLATAVAVVVLVAATRLYRGAHHPSDVLGSLLLTIPWLYALHRLLPDGTAGRGAKDVREPADGARLSGPVRGPSPSRPSG